MNTKLCCKAFSIIACIWLMTGCATSLNFKSPEMQGKKFGLYVELDQAINIKTIGTTAITNSEFKVPVENWDQEKLVENAVLSKLGKKYSVVNNPQLNRDRVKVSWVPFALSGGEMMINEYPSLKEFIDSNNIDYLIVIKDVGSADTNFGTNQSYSGTGVVQRFLGGKIVGKIHHVFTEVSIHDAKTGKLINVGPLHEREYWAEEKQLDKTPYLSESDIKSSDIDRLLNDSAEMLVKNINKQLDVIF